MNGTSATPVIHVIDDDESFRSALVRLLEAAGHEAQGYASAGEFLLQIPADRPGCVLLDLQMPGPSGLDLQAGLQRQGITLPIIFLTGHAEVAASVRAMKAGAVDFLSKPVEAVTLLDAVRQALERDQRRRAASIRGGGAAEALRRAHGPRAKVFDGVVSGMLNKQIAAELGVAERTVKTERAQAMAKLGVSSSAELGQLAERLQRLSDE